MNRSKDNTSVLIISSFTGKTPKETTYSFIFDEAYRLGRKGLNVHIIRQKLEGESISYGIHYHGLEKEIDIRAIGSALTNFQTYPLVSLFRNPRLIYRENLYAENVSRIIKEKCIDLIHAHYAYPEGLWGMLAKKKTGIPLILTSHGYDLNILKEYNYGMRINSKYDALIRRVVQECDHIIVPSNLLYRRAIEVGAANSKISIIPNAVDTGIFHPSLSGSRFRKEYLLGNAPIVLTIRLLEPHYRVDKVIKIAKIIPKEIKCKFVIIGDGKWRPNLISLAGKLLNKRIFFIGKIPHIQIPRAISAADVVFDPCPIGQGINILEAMGCAKPVIGVNTYGLWDYIVDSKTGFLINFDNDKTFAEKIIYLIQNTDEAKRIGMNGRKVVEKKFNINKRIKRIIELYKYILK